ncbi:MAG: 50S ribosomal protein L23 [Clostridia bacterium]|nr:50S ribosomal protein L23 [Clostridia bacterium]MCR5694439.1 50S ribosomal protein L23 [Clostridia bacterium]
MKDYEVIIRPQKTEKSSAEAAEGKYSFIVANTATKIDIKRAVENLFGVKVLSVNTLRYDGKKKTRRQSSGVVEGKTASYKKAIVKIDRNAKPVSYIGEGGKVVKTGRKFKDTIEGYGE